MAGSTDLEVKVQVTFEGLEFANALDEWREAYRMRWKALTQDVLLERRLDGALRAAEQKLYRVVTGDDAGPPFEPTTVREASRLLYFVEGRVSKRGLGLPFDPTNYRHADVVRYALRHEEQSWGLPEDHPQAEGFLAYIRSLLGPPRASNGPSEGPDAA